jgi:two-component system CheB/CheR fusion protein
MTEAQGTGPAPEGAPLFVVGVGASAGGLEALQRLFESVSPTGRLAFVVVQHLSPDFKSMMDELLARHTTLAIHRAEDGMPVEADALYLIPPRKEMTISGGKLVVRDREPETGLSFPIDLFFTSLAQDLGPRAVGIVLSGTGSDGSRGLRAIHDAGGLVFAQSEESAKFAGMPRAAVDTGIVDFVLAPDALGAALVRLAERGEHLTEGHADDPDHRPDDIQRALTLLRRECGVDFSGYKPTTVSRRIERRALLSDSRELSEYVDQLEKDPAELRNLYKDLLIGVTRFYRDADAFERLQRDVLPQLVDRLPAGEELRVWVAGCATGEEAYSVGIAALETFRARGRPPALKIFATDIHRASLDLASPGMYPPEAIQSVPQELRDRYFQPLGEGFQVTQELRSAIVFAHHNLLRDAPFTRLDLVTCRNLLIYFQQAPQQKVMSLFHFALKPQGYLFLGPSETPGALTDEFTAVDARWKIFRKRREVRLPAGDLTARPLGEVVAPRPVRNGHDEDLRVRAAREALVRSYAPPTLILDDACNLLHAFNGAGSYLSQRDGAPTLNALELLGGELRFVVGAALKRVQKEREPVSFTGVQIGTPEGSGRVDVVAQVVQVPGRGDDVLMVTLRSEPEQVAASAEAPISTTGLDELTRDRIAGLETELRTARENLQATIEEMESGNEELQATNEELIASNEELQSTNEELHSVNEELYTVNAEYQAKIAELTELTADVNHLLEATQVHTLFLDDRLRLRKFTPRMAEFFNLLAQDVGRPIEGFAYSLDHPGLLEDLRRVLASGEPIERDVVDRKGHAYLLRILTYRPAHVVQGVVLTLVDVHALKQAAGEVRRSEERYRTLARAIPSVMFTASADGAFEAPQPEWEAYTGQGPKAMRDAGWLDAIHVQDRERVAAAWGKAVSTQEICTASGRVWHAPSNDWRYFTLRAAPVRDEGGKVREWVGNVIDVHAAKLADLELHEKTAQLSGILENSPMFIWAKDLTGRYLFASRACEAVLGLPADRVRGRTDDELLPREVADALRKIHRTVVDTGEATDAEVVITHEGEPHAYLIVKFPLEDAEGNLMAVAGIATDVTERRKAAEESRQAVERRDRLMAMLSHELRTPLGAIVNAAQLLERGNAGGGRNVDVIRRQSHHMKRLIDDLLDVARVTRDQLALERKPIDLVTVVNEALEAARGEAEAKGLRLVTDVPDVAMPVVGDRVRLQQVVANVLGNAVKFTPSGEIAVSVIHEGAEAVVRVRDTGAGMASEEVKQAFELFYQGPQGIDRSRGGLGVGLHLARNWVAAHGGTIAGSSPGKGRGSEFVIRLPLGTLSPPAATLEAPPPPAGGLRIAIVEDNDDIRSTMRDLLELEGHEVVEAVNGEEGVQVIMSQRPDLAFVDIGLPALDGYGLVRRVRAAGVSGVRLIALSGYGRPQDRAAAAEAGFDAHLVKPVEAERVIQVVTETMADRDRGADSRVG